jgi:Flp pilus assembly protein TadD
MTRANVTATGNNKTMTGSKMLKTLGVIALVACLAACSTAQPPPKQGKVARRDWIGEIRTQAAKLDSAVEVAPLDDPGVADLKAKAHTSEDAKDYDAAAASVTQAIKIRGEDPALWQWSAELSLMRGAYADAEHQASHAYELGPKVGGLCARAWLAIAAARTERGDPANAASAQAEVPKCQVASPVRM